MWTLYKLLAKISSHYTAPTWYFLYLAWYGLGQRVSPPSLSAFAISARLIVSPSRPDFTTVPWGILVDVRGICALQIIMKHPGREYWVLFNDLAAAPCQSSELSQQWQMTANCSAPVPMHRTSLYLKIRKKFPLNGNFSWARRTIYTVELILQFLFLLWNKSSSLKWLECKYINVSCLILNLLLLAISLGSMTAQILMTVVAWDAGTPQ